MHHLQGREGGEGGNKNLLISHLQARPSSLGEGGRFILGGRKSLFIGVKGKDGGI